MSSTYQKQLQNLPRLCQEDTNLRFWIHALSAELLKLFKLLSFFYNNPKMCQDCFSDWDPLWRQKNAEQQKAVDNIHHTHTLAQNCHCEFCCGMHLTCKNNPIKPDRNGSVKRPDTESRSYHRWLDENWKLTLPYQTSQIVPTLADCENCAKLQDVKTSCLKTARWFLG